MNAMRNKIIGILAASLLSAHATAATGPEQELNSGPYVTRAIESDHQVASKINLSVGDFSPRLHNKFSGITSQVYFECSPTRGLVSTGDYSSFSDYIRSAFIGQLRDGGRYVADAPVMLSGELQKVELYLDSFAGETYSNGTWTIQLTLRSSLGSEETFTATHSYPIRNRNNYCEEMASQFMTGVQSLMIEILSSERFNGLINRTPLQIDNEGISW